MILKASGALACVLALVVAVPAMGADGGSGNHPAKPAKQKVCRVLPSSAQPKPAPPASRRVQHGTAGASQTITVVVPRTTCNAGS